MGEKRACPALLIYLFLISVCKITRKTLKFNIFFDWAICGYGKCG